MKTTINNVSDNVREIVVNLSAEEIKPILDQEFNKERSKLVLPGFRKGKAPIAMVKKLYGDAIEYRATEKIAENKFWDAVDAENLKPVSVPKLTKIDYKGEEGMEFKAEFEVIPDIDPKDYTNLDIEKLTFEVTDDLINQEFTQMRKQKATFEEAEIIDSTDYQILVDLQRVDDEGNPYEGSEPTKDMKIDLNAETINPEILENVKNKKLGDEFEFSFNDEHKHGEEVHQETFKYKSTITKIDKVVLPELTDEFISTETKEKHKTVEEYKSFLTKSYEDYYNSQSEDLMLNSLLSKISENNKFEVPSGYSEMMLKRLVDYEIENAQRQNKPKPDENILKENIKPKAEWTARWQILMEAIAKKESIEITDEDLKVLAEKEAAQTGISVDKLINYYKQSGRESVLLEDKVIDFLKENNNIKEISAKEKEKQVKAQKETSEKE